MAKYELIYLIPATYAETELKPVIDGVAEALTKVGATMTRNDLAGKLKLAYPVGRARYAFYVLAELDMGSGKLAEIDNVLRLHTDVIRHHLVVKNPKAKPFTKLSSIEDVDRERTRDQVGRDIRARQAISAPKPEAKKVEIDMADIDQKLDKIIEGQIL